jgi:hypothetical protein
MSYLKESKCVKVLTRNSAVTNMTAYLNLSLPINEDATCYFDRLNTASPATTVYAEWKYINLSGFCQMMPNSSPTATPVLYWNFFNCGRKNPNTGYNPIDLATSLKHFNKQSLGTVKNSMIGLKSFSLSKDVSYMMYDTNTTGSLNPEQITTLGALFILPIGDNR